MTKDWETYEDTATALLDRFAEDLRLVRVEGKQALDGTSGTVWEVDGRAVASEHQGVEAFLLVEVKRHKKKLPQALIATFAYSIKDTGASGGIVVTPIGLQKGAAKVAKAEGITWVYLDKDANRDQYVMQFLNRVTESIPSDESLDAATFVDRIMVGLAESVPLSESLGVVTRDQHGNIVDRTTSPQE